MGNFTLFKRDPKYKVYILNNKNDYSCKKIIINYFYEKTINYIYNL